MHLRTKSRSNCPARQIMAFKDNHCWWIELMKEWSESFNKSSRKHCIVLLKYQSNIKFDSEPVVGWNLGALLGSGGGASRREMSFCLCRPDLNPGTWLFDSELLLIYSLWALGFLLDYAIEQCKLLLLLYCFLSSFTICCTHINCNITMCKEKKNQSKRRPGKAHSKKSCTAEKVHSLSVSRTWVSSTICSTCLSCLAVSVSKELLSRKCFLLNFKLKL